MEINHIIPIESKSVESMCSWLDSLLIIKCVEGDGVYIS